MTSDIIKRLHIAEEQANAADMPNWADAFADAITEITRLTGEVAELREKLEAAEDEVDGLHHRIADIEAIDSELRSRATAAERALAVTVEDIAKAIYDVMPFDGPPHKSKPAWVEGGNSLKQDEARRRAREALPARALLPPQEDTQP